ncbi:MAG: hypothetical protein CVU56_14235 [Deltaproteobacteria bacterium HGW-Deltaproteobacteria-14]|jgi:SAM-dependent methyltransferase|nr:MAG: hypothetical protein CVU56_14235 [Deltaproteobacteria bacterium HGW-Deltaproteobacteria-14]
MDFVRTPWLASHQQTRTSLAKRAVYRVARPLLSLRARRALSPELLAATRPDLVLFTRGLPLEDRRAWAVRGVDLSRATVLVQGTGTGWDVISWAALRPREIIATDLYDFSESWSEVAAYCNATYGVPVRFQAAPLEDHGFLAPGTVDLAVSDAVFEHCTDLGAVLAETRRVLRPGGRVYASYGPLWYGPGGDHFSGRGGLATIYNHVLLAPDAYRAYFAAQRRDDEDFQSGGRYVELDLFSKLTTRAYLGAFAAAGFTREGLVYEAAAVGLRFRAAHPALWERLLLAVHPRADRDDLLVRGHLVRLRAPR